MTDVGRPSASEGMLVDPVVSPVSFEHDGDRLVGDLVTPPTPGPHPAVVFVEGSGPGGRDQGDWPTRLAAAGFASLAYDKPGCGESSGDWTTQTLESRAGETLAAVDLLRRREDIRSVSVSLLGGSQGGWVATLAASESGRVAAVVAVSGPGVTVAEQEEYRLTHQLRAEGFQTDEIEQAIEAFRARLEYFGHGRDGFAIHAVESDVRDAPWYRYLAGTSPEEIHFVCRIAAYDPVPALKRLRCPFLAMFGADDVLVPVDKSIRVIQRTLAEAQHDDHRVVVFPGSDHSLRVYTGEGPPRIENGHYMPGALAPGVMELTVTWLGRRIGSDP